ncbi:MAG: proline--tRNA ligase [Desulfomonile tiedjei]|nr:proline--tRNA ligase [Desulfomonile tiedjei]
MKMSRFFVPTLKEDPADAEVISHKLMMRAGMIRKLTAGIYSYLPLGYRALRKVEQIVREEMDLAGAQEVFLPMVQPGELWVESGRWEVYGKELLRFKDRHDRDYCLGPTHEEVITDLVRRDVRSYRHLPLNLYQIQTKFRDEIRPRFGLMRGREFMMKDGYSFDVSDKAADVSYSLMWQAYKNVFARCGLRFRAVEADSGPIGGSFSHEFMVLADTGEDTVVACTFCDYAANMEKAEMGVPAPVPSETCGPMRRVDTPGASTIEDVSKFLNVKPEHLIKTLILRSERGPVAVLIRGDHELNLVKVKNHLNVMDLDFADSRTIEEVTGGPLGFSGPVGLKNVDLLADHAIRSIGCAVAGANEKDAHLVDVNPGRDFHVDRTGDFRCAMGGDPCPRCGGKLQLFRGIEVGHLFKLGEKYSEAMNARFLDAEGAEKPMVMGCYGIGISRTVAAAIEQNHDEDGIIFPPPIAPFTVIVTPVGAKDTEIEEAAEHVYAELWANGIETLLDDRDERPGVKFKDADLIGIPFRITIGKKAMAQGKVELRNRKTKKVELVDISAAVPAVKDRLEAWSAE